MWKERIRVDKLSPAWTEVKMNTATDRNNRNLIIWLGGVCLVIYCMIVVGGVTRLTQSGFVDGGLAANHGGDSAGHSRRMAADFRRISAVS